MWRGRVSNTAPEAGGWNTGDTYMAYVKCAKSITSLAATRSDRSVDFIRRVWGFNPIICLSTMKNNIGLKSFP